MNATTVAVDLAKNVFQLAIADEHHRIVATKRLNRSQFERFFHNREVGKIVMEACGSAHYWGRRLAAQGHSVRLLPPQYVRPYVRRNKHDAADTAGMLEANRAHDICSVPIKSVEQQSLQGLHRVRQQWVATRTARINALRGICREFGIDVPVGARRGLEHIAGVLRDPQSSVGALIRPTLVELVLEIKQLEDRIDRLEHDLGRLARQSSACQDLMSVPGVGLITATAMVAATAGSVSHFSSARHFASWLGLTPREHSSGNRQRLGRISKRGDKYLRMLLVHGARAVLRSATLRTNKGQQPGPIGHWGQNIQRRGAHANKAGCAVANKLARVCFAVLRDQQPYREHHAELSTPITNTQHPVLAH